MLGNRSREASYDGFKLIIDRCGRGEDVSIRPIRLRAPILITDADILSVEFIKSDEDSELSPPSTVRLPVRPVQTQRPPSPMTEDSDLLTTAQTAEASGLSIRTVQDRIDKGILPAQKVGRILLVKRSDLPLLAERPRLGRPPTNV